MSSFYSGQQGQLYINGTKAAKVQNWSFNTTMAPLETTTLEDRDRTSVPGLRNTAGTCQLFYYSNTEGAAPTKSRKDRNSASTLIDSMIKATAAGTVASAVDAVTLKLAFTDGSTTGRFIEGQVWLTSVSMSMAVGTVLSANVSFEFNGAPTGVDL